MSRETGWLCHYEIQNHPIDYKLTIQLNSLSESNSEHILTFYAQHLLNNKENNTERYNKKYVLIYEPFEMDFEKFIRRAEKSLTFTDVIKYLTQIINQLRILRDKNVFPVLEMDGILISQG